MAAIMIKIPIQPQSIGVRTDILNETFDEVSGVLASRFVR
jgi:hypothetical protein